MCVCVCMCTAHHIHSHTLTYTHRTVSDNEHTLKVWVYVCVFNLVWQPQSLKHFKVFTL